MERAINGEQIFACIEAPPRFAKTESVLHMPAFALRRFPEKQIAYLTYGDRLARSKSRKALNLAHRAGVRLAAKAVNEWRTREGGGLVAGGVMGPVTGQGFDLIILDDVLKNRIEAESPTYRARLVDFVNDVAMTRLEPGGSMFIFGTRWHEDDLMGVQVREKEFQRITLPAISVVDGEERSLWPERWPLAELQEKREKVGLYTWDSLYQQNPRPRGATVFEAPHSYSSLPRAMFRTSFGLDLAYSAKKRSDWSVCVRMIFSGGIYYVVDVRREKKRAPQFKADLLPLHASYPNATWRWYAPGPEIGVADFFVDGAEDDGGIPVNAWPTKGDKFIRSIPYAAAWNAGKVLVPERAPWLGEFLQEHRHFTGRDDPQDDQVDAAVAAFDELVMPDADVETEPSVATYVNPYDAAGV